MSVMVKIKDLTEEQKSKIRKHKCVFHCSSCSMSIGIYCLRSIVQNITYIYCKEYEICKGRLSKIEKEKV